MPATLSLIFVLLFLNFGRVAEPLIIMAMLPLALVGGRASATVLALLVVPAVYCLWQKRALQSQS